MLDLMVGTITTGLLWSLLAVGVFITFRVLDVADLTVEGTFPMGAAISAVFNYKWHESNPFHFTCRCGRYDGRCCNRLDSHKTKNSCIIGWYFDNDCFVLCEPSYYGQS